MSVRPERRKTRRFQATAPLVVDCLDSRLAMKLSEVSSGGFSVRSEAQVAMGVVMRFRFSTADGAWTTLLSAQSIYIRPDAEVAKTGAAAFTCGFKFSNAENSRIAANIKSLIGHATAVISVS